MYGSNKKPQGKKPPTFEFFLSFCHCSDSIGELLSFDNTRHQTRIFLVSEPLPPAAHSILILYFLLKNIFPVYIRLLSLYIPPPLITPKALFLSSYSQLNLQRTGQCTGDMHHEKFTAVDLLNRFYSARR